MYVCTGHYNNAIIVIRLPHKSLYIRTVCAHQSHVARLLFFYICTGKTFHPNVKDKSGLADYMYYMYACMYIRQ